MKINDENEEEKEREKNLKNTAIVLKINKTKIKGKKDKNNGTKSLECVLPVLRSIKDLKKKYYPTVWTKQDRD